MEEPPRNPGSSLILVMLVGDFSKALFQ
ncbi:hypothetical protein A2U01_0052036, partial [Trifolium medium]|nr:hypothetical protein [Trifolium medium]